MTEITAIAISVTCYLAIGAWMLIHMEASDRLGYRWTDAFVVVAAPACGVLWLIWDIATTCARAVTAGWAVLTRPWR